MSVLFIEYPKCSTCKKAKKWLEDHGVDFVDRHIVEDNPTAEELKLWHERSGLPLKRFFNTSGQIYRQNNIKDQLPDMSEEEQYALLATNGMLVKRPLIVAEDYVLVGFKEKEYEERLGYIGIAYRQSLSDCISKSMAKCPFHLDGIVCTITRSWNMWLP